MKYFTHARRKFAAFRTQTASVALAVIDTLFFRRRIKRELEVVRGDLLHATCALGDLREQLTAQSKDEESARAQLMQLRVNPESVRGRTGFMVSAFVPSDVITRLQLGNSQQRNAFQSRVAKVLVEYVLKGLFRVTAAGTMTAMIFEPLGPKSNKRIVSPIFETKDGKHAVVHPPANSLDVRMIQDAQQ